MRHANVYPTPKTYSTRSP